MINKYKNIAAITFSIVILLIIVAHFLKENFIFYSCIETINLYIRELRNLFFPSFHQQYDDYLQLFPAILLILMKAKGIKGEMNWKHLLMFIVLSIIFTQLVVNGIKLSSGILRPDRSNFYSFPSGHTAAAFMTATLLYKEYGFRSHWIGIVAYTVAIVTGLTRILNNKHWLFDVIIGAALGILLTELSYQIVNQLLKKRIQVGGDSIY